MIKMFVKNKKISRKIKTFCKNGKKEKNKNILAEI
jgi:hypothetical protein